MNATSTTSQVAHTGVSSDEAHRGERLVCGPITYRAGPDVDCVRPDACHSGRVPGPGAAVPVLGECPGAVDSRALQIELVLGPRAGG